MNSSGHVGAFPCWNSDGDFGPEGVCRLVSRFLLGHGFGALPAPGGNSLFCFDSIALRVTVSAPNLARKVPQKDFSGASVNAELRHLGARPLAGSAGCDPSRTREIQQTETRS